MQHIVSHEIKKASNEYDFIDLDLLQLTWHVRHHSWELLMRSATLPTAALLHLYQRHFQMVADCVKELTANVVSMKTKVRALCTSAHIGNIIYIYNYIYN